MPPWRHSGVRIDPTCARPVPFCRHGFLPLPLTSARFFVACVPRRVGGVRPHDRLPDQLGVDPSAEHVVAQIERADLLVVVVDDVKLHVHSQLSSCRLQLRLTVALIYFLPFLGFSTCATLIRFAATALRTTT